MLYTFLIGIAIGTVLGIVIESIDGGEDYSRKSRSTPATGKHGDDEARAIILQEYQLNHPDEDTENQNTKSKEK